MSEKKLHTISPSAQSGFTEEGVICISAKIPIGGYAYGQSIPISEVEVENTSNYLISKFSIKILKVSLLFMLTLKSQHVNDMTYETVTANTFVWVLMSKNAFRFL